MTFKQPGTEAKGDDSFRATPKTILLVDDMDETRSITKLFLGSFGYVVHSVPTAESALALFDPAVHDLVVTDHSMPGMAGEEMAHVIKMRSPATPVLMYSGKCPADRSRLDWVIQKPASLTVLRQAIDKLLAPRGSIIRRVAKSRAVTESAERPALHIPRASIQIVRGTKS